MMQIEVTQEQVRALDILIESGLMYVIQEDDRAQTIEWLDAVIALRRRLHGQPD